MCSVSIIGMFMHKEVMSNDTIILSSLMETFLMYGTWFNGSCQLLKEDPTTKIKAKTLKPLKVLEDN